MLASVLLGLGLLLIIAIGDSIATITRARVPGLLISMILFLGLLWTGVINAEAVNDSALVLVGTLLTPMLLANLGTMIPFSQLRQQWRYIVIALVGMLCGAVVVLVVVTAYADWATAVSSAGPLAGGFIATLITTTKLKELGMGHLVAVPVLVLGLQQLVGMPLASALLRRYAGAFIQAVREGSPLPAGGLPPLSVEGSGGLDAEDKDLRLPKSLMGPSWLLSLLMVVSVVAVWITGLTGISATLWALLLGLLLRYLRLLPGNTLKKAGSFELVMIAVTLVVIAALADITPADVIASLATVAIVLGSGALGIMGGGWATSRLLKVDTRKGMPVALTAMFGFPADYLICQEVAVSMSKNEKEREIILTETFPSMLMGGFTSVTISSVILASILISTL